MCLKVHKFLQSGLLGDCSKVLPSYSAQCHALFPFASTFRSSGDALSELQSDSAPSGEAASCVGVASRNKAVGVTESTPT